LTLRDYWEHAAMAGSDAEAVAYVEVADARGRSFFGAGRSRSSVGAALEAVVSSLNRALA